MVALRIRHHRFNFFDSREHGAVGDERRLSLLRYQTRQRGFSCAGRAPEYDREQSVLLDHLLQDLSGPDQMRLAQHLIERARPHSFRQRRVSGWRRGFDRLWK
jgi:hypothetical protein